MFSKDQLNTITTSSSFLTGLLISVSQAYDVDTCTVDLCVANYVLLYINMIVWLSIFVLGIVLQIHNKDYSIVYQTIRVFLYTGILSLFLVVITSVWQHIIPFEGLYLESKIFNTVIGTGVMCFAAVIVFFNTYRYVKDQDRKEADDTCSI